MNEQRQPTNHSHIGEARQATGSPTARWEKAILALLQHSTVEKAAEAAGIHAATLYRWLKHPEFRNQLKAAKSNAYSLAIGRLQQGLGLAVNTLYRVMGDAQAPSSSRVQAAKCIIDQCHRCHEIEEIHERLDNLEEASGEDYKHGAR